VRRPKNSLVSCYFFLPFAANSSLSSLQLLVLSTPQEITIGNTSEEEYCQNGKRNAIATSRSA